ncbi:MAG: T9SS type A sorting domain-containing protein [Flavobacteriaceae bacterium]|nr:T9SS type A sorting domain-containing protein [Flavobacteriaceae bacterium]
MKKNYAFIILLSILACNISVSQEYLQMIDAGTYPVQDVIDSAEAYFEGRDKGRGSGYKQFKRWEYNALRMMKEDGYLPTISEELAEFERYNAYLNETASSRQPMNDNWEELGPLDWNTTTSWNPGVGRITGISIDESNSDHIIIGANTGGVWKTLDGGQNWTPLSDFFSNMSVYAVTIDQADPDIYYFGSSSGLIFKSTDAGATWNVLADISNSLINKIVIHPTNSQIIFACSQNAGIYRSTDGGATWSNTGIDSNAYDVEFKPGDPSVVYASGVGFHKSTDDGATFSQIAGFSSGAKMIGVSPDDAEVVYVVEADSGTFGGFYVSSDSGDSFTELNHAGVNYFGYSTTGNDNNGQAPRDMDIVVNPNNVDEVHIAGILTWRSLDGGVSFTCTSDWVIDGAIGADIGYCHADVDIMLFHGSSLYVGSDGGIFRADDTTNLTANYYTDLTTGIGIRQWYKIGTSQTPDVVVTGGSQDNGSSFYTAANGWIDWIGADGMEGFVDKDNSDIMYGMIQFGRMYRTENAAGSLINISEPGSGSGEWVTPFEQDPTLSNTIYVGYNRVYRSNNKGSSWVPISQSFTDDLDQMKIAPSNNQVMYASNATQLFRTEDGGATNWVQVQSPGGLINSIAIHPQDPYKIAVATGSFNKVLVSNDGGDSWETYRLNLPEFAARAVVWQDNNGGALYVGMNYGIYYIDDTLTEWQPYSTNLPNVIINELEINYADGKIYAGTYGRGLWASPVADDIVLGNNDLVTSETLFVFPNPAGNELRISAGTQINASVRIFDVTGKLVRYLTEVENKEAIDISGLQPGVYFARIETDQGSATKKFIKK